MEPFEPRQVHRERQAEAERLDKLLPSDAFSERVRRTLYAYALIRNSWGSTNIDAGPVELERVAALYEAYRGGITPTGRILPTETEVLNYFALVDGLPTQRFDVSLDDLLALHRDYFRDVHLQNKAAAGQFKKAPNVVYGPFGVLETTPPDRVERDLQSLLDWLNGPSWAQPTIVRAAQFFLRFQKIHPFGDGNGRLGRLATLWVLGTGGLPGVRYCPIDDAINEDREPYYASLSAADHGNLWVWVDYFTARIADGYHRAHLLAQRLQRIPTGVPDESQRLLEWLYVHKVWTFRPADTKAIFLATPRKTVRRRLQELERLGYIRGSGAGEGRRYDVVSLHEIEGRPAPP